MVHALHEAQRVLKPDGFLVDLRPAAVHRRVGITRKGLYEELAAMREKFDDDRAANRAVTHVLREGLFKAESRTQFDCPRVLDTLDEFQAWMEEFSQVGGLPPHDWLVQRVERVLSSKRGKSKIVIRGPLVMRVLRKVNATG